MNRLIAPFVISIVLTGCSLNVFDRGEPGSDSSGLANENPVNLDDVSEEQKTELDIALETGALGSLTSSEIASELLKRLDAHQQDSARLRQALFGPVQGPITWNPSHDSALLHSTPGMNDAVLLSNDSANGATDPRTLVVAGNYDSTPYMVFGGNPFRGGLNSSSLNESMWQFLSQSVHWLTGNSAKQLNNVVLSHLDDSYYFRDYPRTVDWLKDKTDQAVQVNAYQACDGAALTSCLNDDVDLLILSQANESQIDAVQNALSAALSSGIPVLYVHWDGGLTDLGTAIFNELAIGYERDNYWPKYRITDMQPSELVLESDATLAALNELIVGLESGLWDFALNQCDEECRSTGAYQSQFLVPTQAARNRLAALDKTKQPLFEHSGYEIDKLLLLLADSYRELFQFPLDATTSDAELFLRTYFSDHVQYLSRSSGSIPANLGNFGRTQFTGTPRVEKRIRLKAGKPFRAAGVYAFPGEGFTVTRVDDLEMNIEVFINTQRTGATHEFTSIGYTRPKFLRSTSISLKPGESLTLAAPYGGPIQISFPQNEGTVELQFENVGLHPYWNDPEDNRTFSQALAANEFDWAEIATPGFEIHSQKIKMDDTVARNPLWPDAPSIAQAAMTFTHNYPHIVAGHQGEGIDRIEEISNFIESKGLELYPLTGLKHMNADQATCGYGCSGNPYDAYWSYNPIGHGDIHELGHGLEKSRFRFNTENGSRWEGHATTNIYSYYSKSRYADETGQDHSCQNLPFDELYQKLQTAQASDDPFTTMASENLTGWNTGVATYIQFMMATEAAGVLENGWHLWGRLHALERAFSNAIKNENEWLDKRVALGFSNYTWAEAKSIGNNDWMLISLSTATERDFRSMINLYGIAVSDSALAQLDQHSFPALAAVFYGAEGNNYCDSLDQPILPLDGTTAFPSAKPKMATKAAMDIRLSSKPFRFQMSEHPEEVGDCDEHDH